MNVALRTIALCAGYGGLELGLAAACEFVGWQHRVAAYVEREAYAAALLARRMEAGELAEAPIWSDLCTFDPRRWRGSVDCIAAGFPCQPHSTAGRRAGVEDERWIWPFIAGIVRDSGAWLVVLENVPGLLTSGGFDAVLSDLAEMGFAAEWGCLPASGVGASHERERIFILAYSDERGREWECADSPKSIARTDRRDNYCRGSKELAHAECADREEPHQQPTLRRAPIGLGQASRSGMCGATTKLANARGARLEGRELARAYDGGWQESRRPTRQLRHPLFAPSPADERWADILAERPDLAPATESGVRLLVDGSSALVDEHRAHQLRSGGNGVVPLQAAVAIVALLRRLGIV